MKWLCSIAMMFALLIPPVAGAVEPGEQLADAKLDRKSVV